MAKTVFRPNEIKSQKGEVMLLSLIHSDAADDALRVDLGGGRGI